VKKLIIHIGYPKTGSSSLQHNVFSNLYKDGKIEYLNHLTTKNDGNGDYSVYKNYQQILKGTKFKKNEILKELENLKTIGKNVTVLSSESLSHISVNSPYSSSRRSAIENAIKLKNLFNPYFDKIEILMFLRAQYTLIPSQFVQEYKNIRRRNKKIKDLESYINHLFSLDIDDELLNFNYHAMYRAYSDVFGEQNTHILFFEDLKDNLFIIADKLAMLLDCDIEVIKKLLEISARNVTVRNRNGNLTTDKFTLFSYVSNTYALIEKYDFIGLNKLKKFIPRRILEFKANKRKDFPPLTYKQKEFIIKRFKNSNKKLFGELSSLSKERVEFLNY
jgi:hypothetical protein